MKEEIVDVNVRPLDSDFLPEHCQAQLCISRSLGSNFKTGLSFFGLTWLVTGISEGKERFSS